jgi:anti-anti-sigma regulatory factor
VSERDDGDVVLRRLGDGDTSALGVAFDRYHRDVYNFLARLRGNRNDLDDLVQMTFLALPTAAAHFDGRGTPRAFVLDLDAVPLADATAARTLEGFLKKARSAGTPLYISGARPQVRHVLETNGLTLDRVTYVDSIDEARRLALT